MRPVMVLGSTLAMSVVAASCATAPGSSGMSSRYGATPQPQLSSVSLYGAARDSAIAQLIADREGPRVSIRAQVSNVADSRRVRGIFRLEDDAYVVVGHIDADGVLRIAFPNEPTDDGFVRGDRTYQTSEFFAGFNTEYRFRVANSIYHRGVGTVPDAYDGRLGYVFIIASWRPMHFDRFQTGNVWDSFELMDEAYMRDPRPAIEELAALLAGENREAYTVKFARFYNTQTLADGFGGISSGFNGYCSGYAPVGFASSPFGSFGYGSFGYGSFGYGSNYGGNFRYRGTNYYYDAAGDCYRAGSTGGFGLGYRIVQLPVPTTPNRPRAFDVDGHRRPPTPQPLPGHVFPQMQGNTPGNDVDVVQRSPEYRQRGLITDDGPSTGPVRRAPRAEPRVPGEVVSRPPIQEMINRRGQNANDASDGGWSRAQRGGNAGDTPRQGGSQPSPRVRGEPTTTDEPRSYTRPQPRENPQSDPSPRMQAPERNNPPVRSEPSPRMQVPERSEPAPRVQVPERSAPPAARTEPRSEPASRPPERPATPPPASEPPVKPPR